MSQSILIIGESGSGKSRSIFSLDHTSTFLINVIGKDLPFKGFKNRYQSYDKTTKTGNMVTTHDAVLLQKYLNSISGKMPQIKTIVIDDATYLMTFEYMAKAKENGYAKYVSLAENFFNVIKTSQELRDDLTVIILCHSDDVIVNGETKTRIKSIGRMLQEKITLEGLFTIVLMTDKRKIEKNIDHFFVTNSDGSSTCKSPEGMFPLEIPNDLNAMLGQVKKYYNS
ncbi:MAG: AAA family ATPase [Ignavibacteriaceae bacterium]|nr:AAA family ATPase [Ignavibacteriaceae bacterium]